ncbi:LysR family transcriptional regulator [Streptomyces thinghirensis]|nr:LysR family transcriptional regulator [Streptomyces thinghirensis]
MDIAQASASELVRRLEAELDAELFVRGSRIADPHDRRPGAAASAQEALAAADSGVRAVHSLGLLGGGTATFECSGTPTTTCSPTSCRCSTPAIPRSGSGLVGQNSAETAAAVAAGRIEAGLVVLPVDDEELAVTPLLRDEVFYRQRRPGAHAHARDHRGVLAPLWCCTTPTTGGRT